MAQVKHTGLHVVSHIMTLRAWLHKQKLKLLCVGFQYFPIVYWNGVTVLLSDLWKMLLMFSMEIVEIPPLPQLLFCHPFFKWTWDLRQMFQRYFFPPIFPSSGTHFCWLIPFLSLNKMHHRNQKHWPWPWKIMYLVSVILRAPGLWQLARKFIRKFYSWMCRMLWRWQNDIPAIMKLRKQLTKLTLDMDAAKAR